MAHNTYTRNQQHCDELVNALTQRGYRGQVSIKPCGHNGSYREISVPGYSTDTLDAILDSLGIKMSDKHTQLARGK